MQTLKRGLALILLAVGWRPPTVSAQPPLFGYAFGGNLGAEALQIGTGAAFAAKEFGLGAELGIAAPFADPTGLRGTLSLVETFYIPVEPGRSRAWVKSQLFINLCASGMIGRKSTGTFEVGLGGNKWFDKRRGLRVELRGPLVGDGGSLPSVRMGLVFR